MSATKLEKQGNGATQQGTEARPDIINPPRESQTSGNDIIDKSISHRANDHDATAHQQPVPDDNLHIQRPAISVPPIERLPVNSSPESRHTIKSEEYSSIATTYPKTTAKFEYVPVNERVTPLNQLTTKTPQQIDCLFCEKRAMTRIVEEELAAALCCLTCGICCICIPCLVGFGNTFAHVCTNCGNKVAIKPNDSPLQVQRPQQTGSVPSQFAPAPRRG
ncbi:hypothetical protein BDW42DRAFT_189686 [Aspergillus taichungensis]|uniref:LITAF domain-containing protein n=1 Tax=Aspergillus taichungensis TaxID=482145 RepID=A0A2J5HCT9_9EURO|nr:hypothetical protein BDW42DRAFT_189686 [Aspergillus taichungensis]